MITYQRNYLYKIPQSKRGYSICQLTTLSCEILEAHLHMSYAFQRFSRSKRPLLLWGPSSWPFLSREHDMWWKNKRSMKVGLWFFVRMGEDRLGFGSLINLMKLNLVFLLLSIPLFSYFLPTRKAVLRFFGIL